MITERNIQIKPLNVPDWIGCRLMDKGGQELRLYTLTADEADDLLRDFTCKFKEKFVTGKDWAGE